ncbi:MAG: hypothetical protein KGI27_13970 [Thaumarchaeota archaeon]|nr:hypothetical protein [Nitrososphaerota archaeon]
MRNKITRNDNTGIPVKCVKCRWRITYRKDKLCNACYTANAQYRDFGPI